MRRDIKGTYAAKVRLFASVDDEGLRAHVEERRPVLFDFFETMLSQLHANAITEIDFSEFAGMRLILVPGSFVYVISDEELFEYRDRLLEALKTNTSVHTIRLASIPMKDCAAAWGKVFASNKTLRHVVFYSCGITDEDADKLAVLRAVKEAKVVIDFLDERLLSLPVQESLLWHGIHVESDELDAEETVCHRCHSAPCL